MGRYSEYDDVIMRDGRYATIEDACTPGEYIMGFFYPDVSGLFMIYTDDDILRKAEPGEYEKYKAKQENYSLPRDFSHIYPLETRQAAINFFKKA
ncbi:hypothetical protein K6V98_02810 [Collinsella sp. AGMB00827]|uniref:Uncharacterized protein n=1 Tax=Collinsella ureilytica TaxID=2869515 RepID=A0ABS7MIU4_9ACTN|nr:hypothetical protein [Collinsella urealyticum]MBY4797296.1 hypothetical protein [Collinsella urealyticum]